ncbi:MAG: putative DNA modification/repair radical SAM protein [Verrucomicrobiales bacterium]|jgi:putative DNA modification/repair radical SAM protein
MELKTKLEILADAAKYDASCASSGTTRRDSSDSKTAIGSSGGAGICHSYAPDGRCISLLKLLLTNTCIYDCHYCINRRSSDVRRARFSIDEVVQLTLDFYKRNYIEGLFLSSGIIRNPDYTMEQVNEVARRLRVDHDFRGYIHLKTIPEASQELIDEAGRYADRISLNVELPTQESLDILAPEKNLQATQKAMGGIRAKIEADIDRKKFDKKNGTTPKGKDRHFVPAGQSTQMIVGADDAPDKQILERADILYGGYRLRRVYYSAFSPIPSASPILPLKSPPLVREHRLYQADWLMRFYGYKVEEIAPTDTPNLDLEIDPKLSWALRNRGTFPIDVNRASREMLLRIPGIGVRSVNRILAIRRYAALRLQDLVKLRVSIKKTLPFLITADHNPAKLGLDADRLRQSLAPKPEQQEFTFNTAITGEV